MNSIKKAEEVYREREPFIHAWVNKLDMVIRQLGEELEGNCFYHGSTQLTSWFFIYKRINFVNLILDNKVKKMIEIGFNGGHSAVIFLSALPKDGEIVFFDLNDHTYAKPCFNLLQSNFPQVKKFIEGDSRKTMKDFIEAHPEEKGTFDCIHVDGGHSAEIAYSDVVNSHVLLKSGGILILDDTQLKDIENLIPGLLQAGYTFVYQIPTYGFSHVCLMKI